MQSPPERRGLETLQIAFVLLCLQAGVGLLATLGAVVFAAVSRSSALLGTPVLVALTVPALELLLGAALVRQHRWARTGLIGLESALALVTLFRLALHAAPGLGLAGVSLGLLVPVAINGLLLSRSGRAALRRQPAADAGTAPAHAA